MLNAKQTIWKICLRYLSSKPSDIVIAAAVRTPIVGLRNVGVESWAAQLNTLTTEAVIKQAALPKEDIDEIHLVTSNQTDTPPNAVQSNLLRKNVNRTFFSDDLQAITSAIDKLQHGQSKSVIIVTNDSLSPISFDNASVERFKSVTSNGLYDAEIIPITMRPTQRQMVTVTEDDPTMLVKESVPHITTAVALTTSDNAARRNINPLARFLNLSHSSGQNFTKQIQQILAPLGFNAQDIHHWEMQSNSEEINFDFSSAFISTNSIPGIFGQSMHSTAILQLMHLAHALKPKQLGFTVVPQIGDSMAAFLLENPNEISHPLPLLTLYTKDTCPLCDILLEELELNFSNEYRLEKVFIDRKENIRYLRLYRYDIPILFINGQFLCMHRLNSKLLRRKLEEIRNNKVL